jgi:integrase
MSKPKSTGSLYQRGTIWWIQYYRPGNPQPVRESSGSEVKADAEKLLKRRQGEIVTGKFAGLRPERITFRELSPEILDDYRMNAKRTLAHVQRRLTLHLLPALGDIRAANFTTAHIRKYIADRQRSKASNASINRELSIIKRVFRLAFRSDPPKVARIPFVPMLRENNVRKGFLEHDHYLQLRDALPEPLRPLFVVAYHVGCRMGELKALLWRQVDLRALRITLDPGTTKNGEGRTLPIYGDMIEWLKIEKAIHDQNYPDCPYVFRRGGQPIKSFYKSWLTAVAAVGLPKLRPHDLRRSAVRLMTRAGIPEKIAMQVTGHKTRSIYDRYNIVNEGDLRLFTAKMDAHLESLGAQAETQGDSALPDTITDTMAPFEGHEEAAAKRVSRLN